MRTPAGRRHGDNVYMVTVNADDGTNMAGHSVIVMVTNEDEIGTLSGPETVSDYMENGTDAVGTYTVSGGSMSEMANLTLMGDDAGDFTISDGGMLRFISSPNYEMPMDADTDNTYMVTVKAEVGGEMTTHDVMVMVTNEDEIGTLSGPETVSDYMENGTDAVGTYTVSGGSMSEMANLTLMGDDAGDFTISDGGMLRFMSSPNYEMPMDADTDNTYMVTVKAEVGGEMTTHPVTVTVANVDEPGTVTLWVGTDPLTGPAVVGEALTGLVVDSDGSVTDQSWQWMKAGSAAGQFADITGATLASYTPVEADASMYIKVMATYTDAEGSGKTAESPSVMVTNVDDPGTITLWVGTASLTGPAIVGEELTGLVVDPDGSVTDQSWQWMKADSAAGQFADITGATSASYTPVEADASMYIKVMATYTDAEGSGKTAESPSVMVTNVDDPGTVTLWVGTASLTGPAIVGEELTGLVVDSDGSVTDQSWQWMKADSAAGQFADITGATSASYTPVEADASMYIKVMATYTDAEGSGKTAESPSVMVQLEAAPMTLLERYDADKSGTIEKSEAIQAITDYLFGEGADAISKDEAIQVINLYLFG